jgi:hypothetical protein
MFSSFPLWLGSIFRDTVHYAPTVLLLPLATVPEAYVKVFK